MASTALQQLQTPFDYGRKLVPQGIMGAGMPMMPSFLEQIMKGKAISAISASTHHAVQAFLEAAGEPTEQGALQSPPSDFDDLIKIAIELAGREPEEAKKIIQSVLDNEKADLTLKSTAQVIGQVMNYLIVLGSNPDHHPELRRDMTMLALCSHPDMIVPGHPLCDNTIGRLLGQTLRVAGSPGVTHDSESVQKEAAEAEQQVRDAEETERQAQYVAADAAEQAAATPRGLQSLGAAVAAHDALGAAVAARDAAVAAHEAAVATQQAAVTAVAAAERRVRVTIQYKLYVVRFSLAVSLSILTH